MPGVLDEQFHAINPEVAAWSESYYFVSIILANRAPRAGLPTLRMPS